MLLKSLKIVLLAFSDKLYILTMVENPNGSNILHQDLEQIHEDDLEAMDLKWQLSLLSMRAKRYYQRTGKKIFINVNDTARYDKSKVECYNFHKLGHFARECRAPRSKEGQFRNQDNTRKQGNNEDTSSKAMLAIDGVGFDWSDMAEEQVQTNMALMAFSDSEVYTNKTCSKTCLKNYETLKKQCDDLIVKLNQTKFTAATYKRGLATVEEQLITYRKNEVLFSEEVAVLKREVACKDYEINVLKSEFEKVKQEKDGIEFKIEKFDKASKALDQLLRNNSKENSNESLVEEQVSQVTSSFVESTLNVDKETINCDHHQRKGIVSRNNYNRVDAKTTHPSVQRNMSQRAVLLKTGLTSLNTVRPGKPHQDDKGFVDSGCSRHMTGNIAYLLDFKEFDGGYVTFEGGAHVGSNTELLVSPRFTWVFFLATKDETSEILKNFIKEIENLVDKKVKIISCDNGTEFKKKVMDDFCREKGIRREYSVARTPQQNGVAERRNTTLIEAARTMVLVVKPHNKTPYELFIGFKLALSFMRPFGCHVTILNTLDNLGKFDGKSDEGFFVGYSFSSKAFKVYNTRTRRVEENLHIGFLKNKPMIEGNGPKWLFDIDSLTQSMNYVPVAACTISNESVDASYFDSPSKDVGNGEPKSAADDQKQVKDGPDNENDEKDKSEDDSSPKEVNTAGQHVNTASPEVNTASPEVNTSHFKLNTGDPSVNTANSYDLDSPKDMFKLGASHTLEATHVEFFSDEDEPKVDLGNILNSYTVPTTPNTRIHKDHPIKNVIGDVWILVNLPIGKRDIGTKWVFRNKKDERGIVIRNKARIEALRLFLAYAYFMGFLVYQIDVKSAFLYGAIEEEVYVTQPLGFKDPDNLDKVYKVVKALYGLHQALRARYETLANYLLGNGFQRGKIDQTLFIKRQKGENFLIQVYVDDIIFSSTNKELCTRFKKLMKDKFQMSSMGELTFSLGLQVQQKEDGIFISQDKYVDEILKKFNYTDVKSASTPVDFEKPLVKDGDANDVDVHLYRSMIGSLTYLITSRPDIMFARSSFELVAYTDIDYAGATQDRKSTTGGYLLTKGFVAESQKEVGTLRYLSLVVPLKKVGDEAVHKELGDRMERAATTASSLEVEQESVTAAELLTTVRHNLVLPVQVNAAKALLDKKKVIITETSIRSDLHLEDAGGTDCLPTATIFEELIQAFLLSLNRHPLLLNHHPLDLRRNSLGGNKGRKTEVPQDETQYDDSVIDLEKAKDAQAKEIAGLKKRVQKLERKKKSRTTGLKRLGKVGESRRIESSKDKDASKQGRSIE
ncbi:putative ribonuclease H-like domain-containing protein [Tanacetum coccineum]